MKEYIVLHHLDPQNYIISYFKDKALCLFHRGNYKPACIWTCGTKAFYYNNKFKGMEIGSFGNEQNKQNL